jgi:hypothetical protein
MKASIMLIVASSVCLIGALAATAQTNQASTTSTDQPVVLKKTLSDKPFLGTQSVLTLGGDYVNTPKEDYESTGVWSMPLTLDQMHGIIAEIGFGEARKQGEWQLRYRRKLMTMDPTWQVLADASHGLSLSDRRGDVLTASYNLRDWCQLGLAAFVEDKAGSDAGPDPIAFGLRNRESLGLQIDTSFRF